MATFANYLYPVSHFDQHAVFSACDQGRESHMRLYVGVAVARTRNMVLNGTRCRTCLPLCFLVLRVCCGAVTVPSVESSSWKKND